MCVEYLFYANKYAVVIVITVSRDGHQPNPTKFIMTGIINRKPAYNRSELSEFEKLYYK
jgi:hypothetical protein